MSSIIAGITKDLKAVPENLKAKAKGADAKKLLLLNVPYILAGYFCDKVARLFCIFLPVPTAGTAGELPFPSSSLSATLRLN